MTDNEIIKALEIHADNEADCSGCPIYHSDTGETCVYELSQNALDLINRQKAEIERLQSIIDCYEEISGNKKARAEAITEFAERLKEKQWSAHTTFGMREFVEVIVIDQIAKEMKEGVNNA